MLFLSDIMVTRRVLFTKDVKINDIDNTDTGALRY